MLYLLLAHYQFNDFQYALRIYNRGGVLYDHIVAPSSECACGFCGEPLNDSASETRPMVHPECVKNFERFMAKLTRIQTLKLYLSFRKQRSTSGSEHSTSIADALDAEMYMSVFMNDLPSEVEAEKKMST